MKRPSPCTVQWSWVEFFFPGAELRNGLAGLENGTIAGSRSGKSVELRVEFEADWPFKDNKRFQICA